jgi:N,N'-diacetylchitobiose transport system substrate-binding protein
VNPRKVNEKAASRSWFVPTAKNWVNVENGNILRNMLAQILTGKLTIKQAASSAQDNIESVLNAP